MQTLTWLSVESDKWMFCGDDLVLLRFLLLQSDRWYLLQSPQRVVRYESLVVDVLDTEVDKGELEDVLECSVLVMADGCVWLIHA